MQTNDQKKTPALGAGAGAEINNQGDSSVSKVDATNEDCKAEIPNPFDAAQWRLDQTLVEGTAVSKLLSRIPIRKPSPQEFFRVHPSAEYRLNVGLVQLKEEREFYLIRGDVAPHVQDLAHGYTLYLAINRQSVVMVWPARLPDTSGRANEWHTSAHDAADEATRRWVSLRANMAAAAYDIFLAEADIPEPEWPEQTFEQLLAIAFRDRMVSTLDHPLILKLRGKM